MTSGAHIVDGAVQCYVYRFRRVGAIISAQVSVGKVERTVLFIWSACVLLSRVGLARAGDLRNRRARLQASSTRVANPM